MEFRIKCDGGLYIKELIDGNGGRTRPSVTEVIGKESEIKKLDVLKVVGEFGG
ncbi:MAG: hypothetical protein QXL67_02840 [Candidatus Bathyarchaeia archaeon]